MDLVLIGLPGSGKSAVGRRLAARHGAAFVDLDAEIEAAAGMTVPEIFEAEGEAGFRRRERRAVAALGAPDPGPGLRRVISPGGGAILDPRNRWALFRGRVTAWLDVRPEVLAQRLRRSPTVRPLVHGGDPLGRIRTLAAERDRFYGAAHRVNGVAEVGGVINAVERLLAAGPRGVDHAAARLHDHRRDRPGRGHRGRGHRRHAPAAGRPARGDRVRARGLGGVRLGRGGRPAGGRLAGRGPHAPGGRGGQAPPGDRGGRPRPGPAAGRAAASRSSRSAAARWGIRRGSWRPRTCAACRGSGCPRPSWHRWTRPSAARPAWTCPRARTSSGRSTSRRR